MTIVTFVRCKTLENCAIHKKPTIGKRLIRTITIDTKNLDTYLFNGPKKYKQIYEAPKSNNKTMEPKTKRSQKKTSSARLRFG